MENNSSRPEEMNDANPAPTRYPRWRKEGDWENDCHSWAQKVDWVCQVKFSSLKAQLNLRSSGT